MGKEFFVMFLVFIFMFQLINADVITPGYSHVETNNFIENIDEYPDYVFVSGPSDSSMGIGMCPPVKVEENGEIFSDYYKHCSISVYAIQKEDFDKDLLESIRQDVLEGNENESREAIEKFDEIEKKEVLRDIEIYNMKRTFSGVEEVNNYYEVELEKVQEDPINENVKRNTWFVVISLVVSFISLAIIIWIIFRRYKNE